MTSVSRHHLLQWSVVVLSILVVITGPMREVKGHRNKGKFHHKHGAADIGIDHFVKEGEDHPGDNPLRRGAKFLESEHEREHMFDHLRDQIKLNEEEKLPQDEANFLFFKSHDDNDDGKLDGLELYQSILHGLDAHVDEMVETNEEQRQAILARVTKRLIMTVDRILLEDDKDNDGFLSYPEYAKATLADTTLKEYNKKI